MANFSNILQIILVSAVLISFAIPSISQKNRCGQACKTLDDCPGQLICTNSKYADDLYVPNDRQGDNLSVTWAMT
ncbi:hypothetical protein SUGI_0011800 [Cryptomeria japonica]|nr:hypothetical protein SUGI_0011800 [Cryptomeria japonica]